MSESDTYDSADEYTSLMDGHVAESRTDDLCLVTGRKRRSRISNEEVIFHYHLFFFFLQAQSYACSVRSYIKVIFQQRLFTIFLFIRSY